LILAARGYRLETHANVADLKIGRYTEIGLAASLPEVDGLYQEFRNLKEDSDGYSNYGD
jgi:hypothetical protein